MHDEADAMATKHIESELRRLRRRHDELHLLYETTRDLGSTLSVREVLDRLLARVLAHLEAEIGSVLLLDADSRLRIAIARGLPNQILESTALRPGEGISGHVIAEGQPVLVTHIEQHPLFARRNHERYYTHSLIAAPLVTRSQARGVINVNNKRSRTPFEQADLDLLSAIATHAGLALQNADAYERVLEQAQRDSLTGLANHGHFWATLQREIQRARRYARPISLVMVDVDRFKAYNDRYGHPAGDRALVSVARILEAQCRSSDLVARYGGEEFAVILPETPLEGAARFAEKIRAAVESTGFGESGDHAVSVSAGVSVSQDGERSARELVERSDALLYAAKAGGRNRVCEDSTGPPATADGPER